MTKVPKIDISEPANIKLNELSALEERTKTKVIDRALRAYQWLLDHASETNQQPDTLLASAQLVGLSSPEDPR